MKLARKLSLALMLGLLAIMSAYAWVQMRNEVKVMDADLGKNAKFGQGTARIVEELWGMIGGERTLKLIQDADEAGPAQLRIRLIWLNDAELADLGLTQEQWRQMFHPDHNVVVVRPEKDGRFERYTYVTLSLPKERPAALEIAEQLTAQHEYINMNRAAIVVATLLVIGVAGLTALALGYWLVGVPMQQVRDHARAVAGGDLDSRLTLKRSDEMGQLAGDLNDMSRQLADARARLAAETEARISTLEQLRHTDRLTTVGRLAAGIAHELGTPLNVVAGRAGRIVSMGGPAAEYAAIIAEQASRMTAIIRQLLDFSRRQGPRLGMANLRALAARTLDMLGAMAEKQHVTIELRGGEDLPMARVDQSQMQQALANVVLNGIQAMPRGGTLRVEIGRAHGHPPDVPDATEEDYLRVTVSDEGEGISPDVLPHIFEPFFTTKGVGEGTGLGLPVAHGILQEHGGWIAVESEIGRGTSFSMYVRPAEGFSTRIEAAS
jgi:two-component system NtrC family sensor kinase